MFLLVWGQKFQSKSSNAESSNAFFFQCQKFQIIFVPIPKVPNLFFFQIQKIQSIFFQNFKSLLKNNLNLWVLSTLATEFNHNNLKNLKGFLWPPLKFDTLILTTINFDPWNSQRKLNLKKLTTNKIWYEKFDTIKKLYILICMQFHVLTSVLKLLWSILN